MTTHERDHRAPCPDCHARGFHLATCRGPVTGPEGDVASRLDPEDQYERRESIVDAMGDL